MVERTMWGIHAGSEGECFFSHTNVQYLAIRASDCPFNQHVDYRSWCVDCFKRFSSVPHGASDIGSATLRTNPQQMSPMGLCRQEMADYLQTFPKVQTYSDVDSSAFLLPVCPLLCFHLLPILERYVWEIDGDYPFRTRIAVLQPPFVAKNPDWL